MPPLAAGDQLLDSEIIAACERPLYDAVLDWMITKLRPLGFPKPLCKRLAFVVCGLIASNKATLGQLTGTLEALAITPAKGESIARRLQRTLQDPRLDASLLPQLFRPLLPDLLGHALAAHAVNRGAPAFHHQRFIAVVIALDESSQEEAVHWRVAGVPIGGVVLPLAFRTWPQNQPLPEGEYWAQVLGLLHEIQTLLPPELREHVLLTADRAYGVPRLLDVLSALHWNWLLRVQGQTQIRLPNGTCHPLRQLAPRPGTQWSSGFSARLPEADPTAAEGLGVFKASGWRRSQVLAVWEEGEAEPWLLLTSLPARQERLAEYAQRWAIERLFLAWKSHGWDLEASGVREADRLGRLLTGIALATLWRLAMALPGALCYLADVANRTRRGPRQLRLPGMTPPPRPWPAKYSLLSWGARIATRTPLERRTPALCWSLPLWEGRTWSQMCRQVYLTAHGQFSVSP